MVRMIRVLYVDDEKFLLDLTKEFLELSGELHVDTSMSVKDAEEKLLRTAYDVVISDYQMPEANGIEFLKRLRSKSILIPFILFTGRGREEVVIDALNSGADFYIQKGGAPLAQFPELEHKVRESVRRRRAEKALQENERRLSRAQAIGMVGSWELMWSGDKVQMWGSEESFRIFGHPRPSDGIVPREQVAACIPELERVHQALVDLIEKGKEYDVEFDLVPADDRPRRVIHSVAELIRDPGGRPLKVLGVIQDITAQKRTEEALQESVQRYSRLIESIPDWILEMDLRGNITSVNSHVLDKSGYGREELIGKSIFSFIAPEDVEQAVKNTNAMVNGWMGPRRYDLILKGGRRVTLEANGDVLRSTDGSVQGLVLVGRDISTHAKVERELRDSELQLTMAMDLARLAYWEYDVRSETYLFNDRFYALYGTTADREGGYMVPSSRYIRDFVHPDDAELVIRTFMESEHAVDDGCMLKHYVHRIVRRDGGVRFVTVSCCRVDDGKTMKVFGVNQDVTGLKMAEDDLRKANEKLNLLYGINRHDILNQLMVQRSYLELAVRHVPDPSAQSYLRKVNNSISVVQEQIEFTHDYGRLGAVSPQWQSVREIVAGLPDMGRVERLELDEGVHHLRVWADPMLERVFHNLFENSIKYCGKPADIQISCAECDGGLLMTYEDRGLGVPEGNKERIFLKGYGKGTGLGLFFSKEILAITGITIEETGRPGEGARFEMLVPRGRYLLAETPGIEGQASESIPEAHHAAE